MVAEVQSHKTHETKETDAAHLSHESHLSHLSHLSHAYPPRHAPFAESAKREQAINLSRRSVGAKAEANLRGLGYGA